MEDMILRLATSLPGFLLAIVCHEFAHAWAAHKFGDDTAAHSGRLTMNPVVHFDLFGTIIIPTICLVMGGVFFGYAKPVPVDPRRFKNMKKGIFWVSFAGPLANLGLAFLFIVISALFYRVIPVFGFTRVAIDMLREGIVINLVLFTFNLLPFPPLDGSKMASVFMDYELARKYENLQRYAMLFMVVLITTSIFGHIVSPVINAGNMTLNWLIRIMG